MRAARAAAFSFRQRSLPEYLIRGAWRFCRPLGLVDTNGVYGAPRFHPLLKAGVRALVGADSFCFDDRPPSSRTGTGTRTSATLTAGARGARRQGAIHLGFDRAYARVALLRVLTMKPRKIAVIFRTNTTSSSTSSRGRGASQHPAGRLARRRVYRGYDDCVRYAREHYRNCRRPTCSARASTSTRPDACSASSLAAH